ncbi:Hypothetical protein POVN_LOCUS280 [uncultured virus]|nr:Hypothetical protein POVN_LOCUS280 [uncultured virus]
MELVKVLRDLADQVEELDKRDTKSEADAKALLKWATRKGFDSLRTSLTNYLLGYGKPTTTLNFKSKAFGDKVPKSLTFPWLATAKDVVDRIAAELKMKPKLLRMTLDDVKLLPTSERILEKPYEVKSKATFNIEPAEFGVLFEPTDDIGSGRIATINVLSTIADLRKEAISIYGQECSTAKFFFEGTELTDDSVNFYEYLVERDNYFYPGTTTSTRTYDLFRFGTEKPTIKIESV